MTIFSITCYFSVTWMDNVICHRILQTQCIWRSFKCSYRHLKMRKSVGKTKIGFTLYLTIFKYGSSRLNMCGCVQTQPQMQLHDQIRDDLDQTDNMPDKKQAAKRLCSVHKTQPLI